MTSHIRGPLRTVPFSFLVRRFSQFCY